MVTQVKKRHHLDKKQIIIYILLFAFGFAISSLFFNQKLVCEIVEEPYVENTSYEYQFKYAIASDETKSDFSDLFNYKTKQVTNIKNLESLGGEFTIIHNYKTLEKSGQKQNITFIPAETTVEISTIFDTDLFEDVKVTTEIIPQSETRYIEEIKYREREICHRK